jgi:hypothetical protein
MLRDLIVKDFWVKLVSVLAAVFIWGTVKLAISRQPDPVKNAGAPLDARAFRKVPVLILRDPGDSRAFLLTPDTVDITVSAPFEVMRSLGARDFEAFINLTDSRDVAGRLKPVIVRVPDGAALLNVEPREVTLAAATNPSGPKSKSAPNP